MKVEQSQRWWEASARHRAERTIDLSRDGRRFDLPLVLAVSLRLVLALYERTRNIWTRFRAYFE